MNARDDHQNGVRLVYTADERRTWTRFKDDTPEVIICIVVIALCIAVCIATSAGPMTLGGLGSHWQVPYV